MTCEHEKHIALGAANEWLWCKQCGALGRSVMQPPDPRLNPAMMRPEYPRADGKVYVVWYLPTDVAQAGAQDILDMRVMYGAPG